MLLDVERVAPCMPGATLDSVDGDEFSGRVKAKVGPVSLSYKGRARIESADDESYTAVIAARGKDAHGNGTAAATVTMHLTDDAGAARVDLLTELDITGRPAQLGRGVMSDVANAIIGQFATALARQLAATRRRRPASSPPMTRRPCARPPGCPRRCSTTRCPRPSTCSGSPAGRCCAAWARPWPASCAGCSGAPDPTRRPVRSPLWRAAPRSPT